MTVSASAGRRHGESARNMRLLAHHTLNGFGGIGEGMCIQVKGDRRILWLAHESAPKNFTALDVSDPRAPRVIVQTDLPHAGMRSNSLDVVGDIMAVAYQVTKRGDRPAGFELFNVSDPAAPRSIGFFDASGPNSRGVHQLWFADGEYVHMSAGSADFVPRIASDDQFYRIVDVRRPSAPEEVGRWWLPGTRDGDAEPPPQARPLAWPGYFRAHNTNVYPARPDRAYLGYLDAGAIILDISNKGAPRLVSRWDNSPPYPGFTHTVLPLFDRNLLIVTDETIKNAAQDWPKLVWVVDAREETNLVPISTFPTPSIEEFASRGGRIGAHNIHENRPGPGSFSSSTIVVGTFFSAGVRVYDIRDPFRPEEVAHFIPPAPADSPVGAVQINDVFVDDRGVAFAAERHTGGIYILEMAV
jgi:hypothetical protein